MCASHHLFCLAGINAQVVALTPIDKVLDDAPTFLIIRVCHITNNGCVIAKLLHMIVGIVVSQVRWVEGEEERRGQCTL